MIGRLAVAGLTGGLMGAGLVISGMTDANKVTNFLNVAGDWDPSLAFVMGSAAFVYFVAYRLVLGRKAPALGGAFRLPTRRDIDLRLVGGAAMFGVGWGLGGFCPGPGLVASVTGGAAPLVFVATLSAGMLLFHMVHAMLQPTTTSSASTPVTLTPQAVGPTSTSNTN